MQSTRIRPIFIIAGIISLFASYLGIWIRFINDPVERTGSDFIAFYTAGRIAQSKGIPSVYDVRLQQEIQQEQVGFPLIQGQVLLYNHLPFLIPILQVIVNSNYVSSFYRWIVLLIAAYTTGIAILSQVQKQTGVEQNSNLLMAICVFLFLPVFFSLMNGQDTAFLFLGTTLWLYGLASGKDILAGFGLVLTTVRPHIALILAIPMLFRHGRVFWAFVLGSGILALFSILILGVEGTRQFLNIIVLSGGGEWYGMKESAMYNLIGLLRRAMPQLEVTTIRALGWTIYSLTTVGLCILWAKTRDPQNELIGLTVISALFVAPHLHFHDLALLLIPIYQMTRIRGKSGSSKTSIGIVAPLMISILFLIGNISPYLQYSIPYLVMLALALHLYYLRIGGPVISTPHLSSSPKK